MEVDAFPVKISDEILVFFWLISWFYCVTGPEVEVPTYLYSDSRYTNHEVTNVRWFKLWGYLSCRNQKPNQIFPKQKTLPRSVMDLMGLSWFCFTFSLSNPNLYLKTMGCWHISLLEAHLFYFPSHCQKDKSTAFQFGFQGLLWYLSSNSC